MMFGIHFNRFFTRSFFFIYFFLFFLWNIPADGMNLADSLEDRLAHAQQGILDLHTTIDGIVEKDTKAFGAKEAPVKMISAFKDGIRIVSTGKALEWASYGKDDEEIEEISNHHVAFGEGVHFKVSNDEIFYEEDSNGESQEYTIPLDSGYEIAAYYFSQLLVKGGMPPSIFFILDSVKVFRFGYPIEKKYCIQASLTVEGQRLDLFLKECRSHPDKLKTLDYKSLCDFTAVSLLMGVSDAKPENLIVENKKTAEGFHKIMSIDNDHFYFYPFSYEEGKFGESYLSVMYRNICFFLMDSSYDKPIHPSTKETILSFYPEEFLKTWLGALCNVNKGYWKFLEWKYLTEEEFYRQSLSISIRLSSLKFLLGNLKKMQFWLGRDCSCWDLFRHLHPLVYLYYREQMKEKNKGSLAFRARHHLTQLYKTESKDISYKPKSLQEMLKHHYQHTLKDGRTIEGAMAEETRQAYRSSYEMYISAQENLDYLFPKKSSINEVPPFEKWIISMDCVSTFPIPCLLPTYFLTQEQGKILEQFFRNRKNTLQIFNISENYLSINSFSWLIPLLRKQKTLEEINLCDNNFQAGGIVRLCQDIFPRFSHLTSLNLAGNWMKGEGIKALAHCSENYLKNLVYLSLAENELTDRDKDSLLALMFQLPLLRELDVRWNKFSDVTTKACHPLILGYPYLFFVLFEGNRVDEEEEEEVVSGPLIKNIIRSAHRNKDLEVLKNLDRYSMSALIRNDLNSIYNGTLESLNISHCFLNFQETLALMESFSLKPSLPLKKIMIYNEFGKEGGGEYILYVIKKIYSSFPITYFNISYCQHTFSYEEIIPYLMEMKKLTTLIFHRRKIDKQTFTALMDALCENASIKTLDLSHNDLDQKMMKPLEKMLRKNEFLTELDLSWTGVTDKMFEKVKEALWDNTSITKLNLRKNEITEKSVNAIQTLIKTNKPLKQLELGGNFVSKTNFINGWGSHGSQKIFSHLSELGKKYGKEVLS